ncbi:hypothetical protein [Saccharibacter floricola]|uniref:Uncharacterized protein n=1 Tax=Saccharibacter floricola DSM 15669 TaxID=1123227 RepID=A0ABQ0NZU9_9PROT|nr:hypothetical protein [Saccharibacter floricola]GBQ07521.1 hypothetical protein AA15669_1417 [Saccharibacter floricola DSM 15669]
MAISPNTPQGMLNRLRGSVIIPSNSALNVTSDFLTPEGIEIQPEGNVTDLLDTMTGRVGSQAAKQNINVVINLVRSQSLATAYYNQIKKNTALGDLRIISDSSSQPDRTIRNAYIISRPEEALNGTQVKWNVTIGGYEIVNSDLWEAA